jgi:hypothetical protein
MNFLSFNYFLEFYLIGKTFSYRTLTYPQRLTSGATARSYATSAMTKSIT